MDTTVDFPRAQRGRRDLDDGKLPPLPAHLSRASRRRRLLVHLICISLPVLVALLYLCFNAADRYDVQSDFTVQPLLQPSASALAARDASHLMNLAQNAAPGAYDAYMVVDYLQSPDALMLLEKKIGFLGRYRGKTRDIFFRAEPWRLLIRQWFTGAPLAIPFEDRLDYFNAMVTLRYSITENIVTLEVQAFTPEDAQLIAATLLDMGEDFINRSNDRVLRDLVHGAETQVASDGRRLNHDHFKMKEWRGGNSDLDPDQLTAMVTQVLQGLENSLVTARTSQMLAGASVDSSVRGAAALRVKTIAAQIAQEQRQLAVMEQSYASKFYEYDRLKEDIAFAKSAYQNDLATLQTFRELVAQQGIYLLRIDQPHVPDEAIYPEWVLVLPLTLLGGAMAYGILRMVMALGRDKWAR
jgi:capsular polysaccharide transport system permease protein